MKEAAGFLFMVGVCIGLSAMGIGMTYIGPNSKAKVDGLKTKCELNIPRNQSCVM